MSKIDRAVLLLEPSTVGQETRLPPERFVGPPVRIDEFAHHRDFLGLGMKPFGTWEKPLGSRQLGVLEEFFAPDAPYTELILLWGKGSGKDHVASIIIAYMVYRTLLLEDPQAHYNQAPGSYIDFVNVAQSADQAQSIFFESSLKPKIAKSPWFNDSRVRGKFRRNKIVFPKGIRAISTHSQSESFEGFNLLGWVMDEAAAFRSKRDVDNAKKIWNTLRTSMTSRFGRHGCGCILSYPRHQGDFILKRYDEVEEKHEKWALRDRGATWEINPTKERSEFQDDYDRDPIDAAAKYECFAPIVEDAYLPVTLVAKCLTGLNMDLASLPPLVGESSYVVCLDPATYSDTFGMVIAYKHLDGRVIVPCVHSWKPKPKQPVDLKQVDTEVSLFAKLRKAHILTDGQGIAPMIQKWQAEGIPVTIVSQSLNAQMEQWSSLKQAMQSTPPQIECPNDPDLARQLSRLRIRRMGEVWKVEAQQGEHDDLADPLCWATWALSGALGGAALNMDLSKLGTWKIGR